MKREVVAGWISSGVEAYNMAIYSFLAPVLAGMLFKGTDSWKALLFSYLLTLVAACLMYPLGALYYGIMGDRSGRQALCVHATLGLAFATAAMGFIPYNNELTWISFLGLICAQYFFSGGEYQGSIVFSLEHGGDKNKGLLSSLSCLSAVCGLVLANGLAAFSTHSEWVVRGCFMLGGLGGLVSYVLKYTCRETPAFISTQLHEEKGMSFIFQEWKKIGRVILALSFFIVGYTFIFIFLPAVHPNASQFDTVYSLGAYGVFLVCGGYLGDRIGIEKIMKAGLVQFSLLIFPACLFLNDLFVLQLILTLCASLFIGPLHSWVLDQFEPKIRCRAIFVCSAVSISIFGGLTMPLCLLVYNHFHSLMMAAFFPLVLALFCHFSFSNRSVKILSNR